MVALNPSFSFSRAFDLLTGSWGSGSSEGVGVPFEGSGAEGRAEGSLLSVPEGVEAGTEGLSFSGALVLPEEQAVREDRSIREATPPQKILVSLTFITVSWIKSLIPTVYNKNEGLSTGNSAPEKARMRILLP
jgi:hypothetical protein